MSQITVVEIGGGNYFLSKVHWDKRYNKLGFSDCVPISYDLPMSVAPRAGIEDGLVDSKEDVVFVFYSGVDEDGNAYREIVNPIPELQA